MAHQESVLSPETDLLILAPARPYTALLMTLCWEVCMSRIFGSCVCRAGTGNSQSSTAGRLKCKVFSVRMKPRDDKRPQRAESHKHWSSFSDSIIAELSSGGRIIRGWCRSNEGQLSEDTTGRGHFIDQGNWFQQTGETKERKKKQILACSM